MKFGFYSWLRLIIFAGAMAAAVSAVSVSAVATAAQDDPAKKDSLQSDAAVKPIDRPAAIEFGETERLTFKPLRDLPDAIGVAGPIVGVIKSAEDPTRSAIVVAGGANFATPDDPQLWELPKKYHTKSWLLERTETPIKYQWTDSYFELSEKVAYSSMVSTPFGLLCMGGEDENGSSSRAFLLEYNFRSKQSSISENDLGVADLPLPCTAGGAAIVDGFVYLVAGKVTDNEGSAATSRASRASRIVWRMSLANLKSGLETNVNENSELWEQVVAWPDSGPRRMFPQVIAQHDGFKNRLYVIGGRSYIDGDDGAGSKNPENLQATTDGWAFDPSAYNPELFQAENGNYDGPSPWRKIAESPVPLTAGTAFASGPAHIIVPAAATLEYYHSALKSKIEMKDFDHPGFPKRAYAYHTVTDSWTEFGATPVNQVTTQAVRWGDDVLLISGEIRPRVRTNKVWQIVVNETKKPFGNLNMGVLIAYLIAMLGIGLFFTFKNKSTDDYFRGGKSIPWWAAGCSIFATMLSSITYMAVPAKAFSQDWVYWVGSFLILAIAPIAIYFALPFFRRIDATSAYEYLELRFNRPARLIGSGSFSLFHIFRMGVVLALAAGALASITPLDPRQCVFVMGALSIVYCTLGGVEAVIWTDTIQTFILLGGAMLCLVFAVQGSDPGSFSAAVDAGKLHMVNLELGSDSFMIMALWVVILGGIGQNLASYTADQAVVQRYMTTGNQRLAAKSIWLNGVLAIPASAIFFGMGTAFWMFYRSNPDRLDPTIAADRIMPLFLSQEMPAGLAGLVVAGIFSAAQSTVSTSMNSGATTIITDFIKPLNPNGSDQRYLWLARIATLVMGILGMLAGLFFIDPTIKSLFDQFIGILGMFLGVLAGLFALGATSRRASGVGSLIGAGVAILFMMTIVFAANDKQLLGINIRGGYDAIGLKLYAVNGYLYAFIGIVVCYCVGLLASLMFPMQKKPIKGLTFWE